MFTTASQVILRNLDLLDQGRVLILNQEDDLLAHQLTQQGFDVTSLALDYHHFLRLQPYQNAKLNCQFGHQLNNTTDTSKFDNVIVYFPKAKALAPYLCALAAAHLKPEGMLLVVGENKGGIKSLPKLLDKPFSPAVKRDNARHCLLYSAVLIETAPAFDVMDWRSEYQLTTPQGELTICNLVGVFSEKKLDQGTELLLAHLPALQGRVLDFGCGAGVIAAALLKAQPELQLDCVDINAMALAACQMTLEANQMQGKVYASDGLAQTQGQFAAIVSNPPFHDGLTATTDIALQFTQDSHKALIAGGIWQIVANRHLPYSDTIAHCFGQVTVVAENNKYKVYRQQK